MGGKYAAQYEVRENLGCILWLAGFGGISVALGALPSLPSGLGWVRLSLGVALIAVAAGIWQAREWSRWAAGTISAALCLSIVGSVVGSIRAGDFISLLLESVGVLVFGALARYSFQRSTRTRFAEAREAIARARAVPR
jgi:hypothetical protein